jgi:hypothetical protein
MGVELTPMPIRILSTSLGKWTACQAAMAEIKAIADEDTAEMAAYHECYARWGGSLSRQEDKEIPAKQFRYTQRFRVFGDE